MRILDIFKKNGEREDVYAPVDGQCIMLEDVDDEVFSKKILGDGVAVVPESDIIKSPINGKITHVFDTKHAYGITGSNGIELLIHVGIDTVRLGGEGFEAFVSEGDRVERGTPLAKVDLSLLKQRGFKYVIPVIVTNPEKFSVTDALQGDIEGDKSIIMKVKSV